MPFEWLLFFVCIVFWIAYAASGNGYTEWQGLNPLGRDFYNFYTGGKAAWTGGVAWLYDRELYSQNNVANGIWPDYNFSYPPHALMLLSVFGLVPYKIGFAFWSFGSAICYITVARKFPKPDDDSIRLLTLFAPAVMISFFWGQTGMWVAALLGAGLMCVPQKPLLAGVLFGLLTVKPQLGFLLAPMLLFGGHYRVIVSAGLTTLVLCLLSVMAYGVQPWMLYVSDTLAYQAELLERSVGVFDYMVLTPYRALYLLGLPKAFCMTIHVAIMLFMLGIVWRMTREKAPWTLIISATLIGTVFMSPYFVVYDLVIVGLAALAGWASFAKTTRNFVILAIFAALSPALILTGLPPVIIVVPTAVLTCAGIFMLKDLCTAGRIPEKTPHELTAANLKMSG